MQTIPARPIPSQRLSVSLNNQACQITLVQRRYGLFMDLAVNNATVLYGVKCLDKTRIVRSLYLPFVGDILFFDTQGAEPPYYLGVGDRYQLLYFTPDEVAEFAN